MVIEPPGEPALLYVDLHLVHEVTSPQAFDGLRLAGRSVRRPDLTIATIDHNVPTGPEPPDKLSRAQRGQLEALRRNCEEFGVLWGSFIRIRPVSWGNLAVVLGRSYLSRNDMDGAGRCSGEAKARVPLFLSRYERWLWLAAFPLLKGRIRINEPHTPRSRRCRSCDPYVLVALKDSPLLRKDALLRTDGSPTLADIAGLSLIGFRDHRLAAAIEAQFQAAGIAPRFVFRSDDNDTIEGLVDAGLGVAVMPRLTARLRSQRLRAVDLSGLLRPRLIGIAWRRSRHPTAAARAFVAATREVAQHLGSVRRSQVRAL